MDSYVKSRCGVSEMSERLGQSRQDSVWLAGMITGHFSDTDEKRCACVYLRYSCTIVVRKLMSSD
jgi:hypothetical protein